MELKKFRISNIMITDNSRKEIYYNMLAAMSAVWTDMLEFLTDCFPSIQSLFIDTSGTTPTLTYIGILATIAVGISLVLLVFNLVRSFLIARA